MFLNPRKFLPTGFLSTGAIVGAALSIGVTANTNQANAQIGPVITPICSGICGPVIAPVIPTPVCSGPCDVVVGGSSTNVAPYVAGAYVIAPIFENRKHFAGFVSDDPSQGYRFVRYLGNSDFNFDNGSVKPYTPSGAELTQAPTFIGTDRNSTRDIVTEPQNMIDRSLSGSFDKREGRYKNNRFSSGRTGHYTVKTPAGHTFDVFHNGTGMRGNTGVIIVADKAFVPDLRNGEVNFMGFGETLSKPDEKLRGGLYETSYFTATINGQKKVVTIVENRLDTHRMNLVSFGLDEYDSTIATPAPAAPQFKMQPIPDVESKPVLHLKPHRVKTHLHVVHAKPAPAPMPMIDNNPTTLNSAKFVDGCAVIEVITQENDKAPTTKFYAVDLNEKGKIGYVEVPQGTTKAPAPKDAAYTYLHDFDNNKQELNKTGEFFGGSKATKQGMGETISKLAIKYFAENCPDRCPAQAAALVAPAPEAAPQSAAAPEAAPTPATTEAAPVSVMMLGDHRFTAKSTIDAEKATIIEVAPPTGASYFIKVAYASTKVTPGQITVEGLNVARMKDANDTDAKSFFYPNGGSADVNKALGGLTDDQTNGLYNALKAGKLIPADDKQDATITAPATDAAAPTPPAGGNGGGGEPAAAPTTDGKAPTKSNMAGTGWLNATLYGLGGLATLGFLALAFYRGRFVANKIASKFPKNSTAAKPAPAAAAKAPTVKTPLKVTMPASTSDETMNSVDALIKKMQADKVDNADYKAMHIALANAGKPEHAGLAAALVAIANAKDGETDIAVTPLNDFGILKFIGDKNADQRTEVIARAGEIVLASNVSLAREPAAAIFGAALAANAKPAAAQPVNDAANAEITALKAMMAQNAAEMAELKALVAGFIKTQVPTQAQPAALRVVGAGQQDDNWRVGYGDIIVSGPSGTVLPMRSHIVPISAPATIDTTAASNTNGAGQTAKPTAEVIDFAKLGVILAGAKKVVSGSAEGNTATGGEDAAGNTATDTKRTDDNKDDEIGEREREMPTPFDFAQMYAQEAEKERAAKKAREQEEADRLAQEEARRQQALTTQRINEELWRQHILAANRPVHERGFGRERGMEMDR